MSRATRARAAARAEGSVDALWDRYEHVVGLAGGMPPGAAERAMGRPARCPDGTVMQVRTLLCRAIYSPGLTDCIAQVAESDWDGIPGAVASFWASATVGVYDAGGPAPGCLFPVLEGVLTLRDRADQPIVVAVVGHGVPDLSREEPVAPEGAPLVLLASDVTSRLLGGAVGHVVASGATEAHVERVVQAWTSEHGLLLDSVLVVVEPDLGVRTVLLIAAVVRLH